MIYIFIGAPKSTNCQTSSKLKAHDSLALLILSLFVQNIYRLLFLLWLLSFHILTALNVTSIKYDCKNVMRLRSVYLQILISSDGWCVSEWSAWPHQDGGERKIASPVQGGHAQGADIQVYEMNLKHSCYPGDRDEGVDREALLQDRCDREGFGQEGHGGGRKVKWPNSFFDFISILLAHIWVIVRCWGKSSLVCQQKSDAL